MLALLPTDTTPLAFVEYWHRQYRYPDEDVYERLVRKRPLSADDVIDLFTWKNGGRLSAGKRESVKRNYVTRLSEAYDLPHDVSAQVFLARFSEGGAIWRIFWLHCNRPDTYPIYDQHVHRAMRHLTDGKCEELDNFNDAKKIAFYLHDYLPFYRQSFSGMEERSVDRALWSYGRFLKRLRSP